MRRRYAGRDSPPQSGLDRVELQGGILADDGAAGLGIPLERKFRVNQHEDFREVRGRIDRDDTADESKIARHPLCYPDELDQSARTDAEFARAVFTGHRSDPRVDIQPTKGRGDRYGNSTERVPVGLLVICGLDDIDDETRMVVRCHTAAGAAQYRGEPTR